MVMPAGNTSVMSSGVSAVALKFRRVSVKVATPPLEIGLGEKALVTWAPAWTRTVVLNDVVSAPWTFETVAIVFVRVASTNAVAGDAITSNVTVQLESCAIVAFARLTVPVPGDAVRTPPPHVVAAFAGVATTTFAGSVSVKATPVSDTPLWLSSPIVTVVGGPLPWRCARRRKALVPTIGSSVGTTAWNCAPCPLRPLGRRDGAAPDGGGAGVPARTRSVALAAPASRALLRGDRAAGERQRGGAGSRRDHAATRCNRVGRRRDRHAGRQGIRERGAGGGMGFGFSKSTVRIDGSRSRRCQV